jgi:hypothetical protein
VVGVRTTVLHLHSSSGTNTDRNRAAAVSLDVEELVQAVPRPTGSPAIICTRPDLHPDDTLQHAR